ncbi:hypothetical protein LshimejAT787_1701420 [Lyophyllum shimeji]|uniref:Uncharacterized protein n=1 Tax=Lyophyllum shimeji TaxID=47721 RepID=A0A9P3UUA1_LYOSH|nr:hypothetical protein LshimejAT787_1701420 [Lyophyllum shimeji]
MLCTLHSSHLVGTSLPAESKFLLVYLERHILVRLLPWDTKFHQDELCPPDYAFICDLRLYTGTRTSKSFMKSYCSNAKIS